MGCYDIKVKWNGKTLILPSDTDIVVFVNNKNNRWDDGTAVTADEMLEFLCFYGRDRQKEKKERNIDYDITFVDGIDTYGDSILFADSGVPLVRIEDGMIKSTAEKCGCETSFPALLGSIIRTTNDYDSFKNRIEESGQFNKLGGNWFSSKQIYECRACKRQWILGKPDNTGCYLWEIRQDNTLNDKKGET